MPKGHVVVGEENDPEAIAHIRVSIHHISDGGDEFDDPLRHVVSRCGFAPKDEGAPGHILIWILLQAMVEGDDVQHVEVLPLVFVDALHLDVK